MTIASPIPVPDIDSDVPVAIIPAASVAPLDGPPDGQRINTFILAPNEDDRALEDSAVHVFGGLRERVRSKPLTYAAAAFSLGFVLSRVLR
ncbi:MAG: hypothetical protein JWP22_512 [Ramlibacter sp.]|jgi:hypothetical protein|nr:hypothetical protein [Ramlibacter sp.]